MPRIRDAILDCVVYLYRSKHEAMEGINIGGSGFLLEVPAERLPPAAVILYVVTNRHVIEAGFRCVRFNTKSGDIDAFEFGKDRWICSGDDDLAIGLVPNLGLTFQLNPIPRECLVSKEFMERHAVGIGDDVLMVGRFINREGLQRNSPTARFGHISQMPGEPISVEIGGKTHVQNEAFLAEVRSIGGYSGSPVYLLPNPTYGREGGERIGADKGHILGVDFCHVPNWTCAYDDRGNVLEHVRVPLNSGMAGVIPARRLEELLKSEKATAQRTAVEEAEVQRRKLPKAIADSASDAAPPTTDPNPTHREDFNSLLSWGAALLE